MGPEHAVLLGLVALLVQWCVNRAVVAHRAKLRYQASCVHNDKIVYAYDDPRWPVAICQICGRQEKVKVPKPILCPHCGEDIRIEQDKDQGHAN